MPRQTEWFHRIPQALEELRGLAAPLVDRQTLQELLHVSPRQALRILHRFAPFSAGKTLLIDRLELIGKLEQLGLGEEPQWAMRRRDRLDQHLDSVRRQLAARRVRIQAPRQMLEHMADLPANIQLTPGRLLIEFQDAQELLLRLMELAQAISNDYPRFQEWADSSLPARDT
jgi:hypothetical protein